MEILEIGELSTDRFRGIFRLTYTGDAHLILSTKVQANPLTRPAPASSAFAFEDASSVFPSSMPSRGILFAARPLVVPMKLRLSAVRLKAIVVLVVSKQKGITLVFKNDPLESVDVSSTFDSVAVIQKYLQQEIEGQLREMFREDLPGIIHRLSQRWLSGKHHGAATKSSGNRTTMAAGIAPNVPSMSSPPRTNTAVFASSPPDTKFQRQRPARASSESQFAAASSSSVARSPSRRRKSEKGAFTPSSPRMTHRGSTIISSSPRGGKVKATSTTPFTPPKSDTSVDLSSSWGLGGSNLQEEMERYDPTYGLRPDEVRMSIHGSGYSGLARLANKVNGGLRDLTLESSTEEEGELLDDGYVQAGAEEAIISSEEEEEEHNADYEESPRQMFAEQEMLQSLDFSDDDVPDHPPNDEDEGDEVNNDAEDPETDFSRFSYPRLGSAFSQHNLHRSTSSAFEFDSPPDGSPKINRFLTQSYRENSRPASVISSSSRARNKIEYETIPAVGGGIITRPRIYHTASRVQAPEVEEQDAVGEDSLGGSAAASSTARGPASSRTQTVRPAKSYRDEFEQSEEGEEADLNTDESPLMDNRSLDTLEPEPMDPSSSVYRTQLYRQQYGRLYRAGYGRQSSSKMSGRTSSETSCRGHQANRQVSGDRFGAYSTSRCSTAPTSTHPSTQTNSSLGNRHSNPSSPSNRDLAMKARESPINNSSPFKSQTVSKSQSMTMGASHHFMDLVNSNHTLSPFTRTLDTKGFAVRSHPVTPSTESGGETSSSVGGFASRSLSSQSFTSRQLCHAATSTGQLERSLSANASGGVRKRTFKLGAKNQSESDTMSNSKDRRPDSTPIQSSRSLYGNIIAGRAYSTASLEFHVSSASSESRRSKSAQGRDLRRRSRPFAQSERLMSMGAIRE